MPPWLSTFGAWLALTVFIVGLVILALMVFFGMSPRYLEIALLVGMVALALARLT